MAYIQVCVNNAGYSAFHVHVSPLSSPLPYTRISPSLSSPPFPLFPIRHSPNLVRDYPLGGLGEISFADFFLLPMRCLQLAGKKSSPPRPHFRGRTRDLAERSDALGRTTTFALLLPSCFVLSSFLPSRVALLAWSPGRMQSKHTDYGLWEHRHCRRGTE